MTVVLDTNCLVQIVPRKAEHRWMYDAILRGDINLAVTTDILDEYVEVLDAFFGSDVLGNLIAKTILELPGTQRTTVHIRWKLIADDPDDDKVCGLRRGRQRRPHCDQRPAFQDFEKGRIPQSSCYATG